MAKQISKPDKTSLVIDREKVARARRILGTTTLAETVDAALEDVINHERRMSLLERIKREGRVSMIMVLHNYVHVLTACDRVNLIQDGVITLDKSTAETSVEELTEIVVEEYRRALRLARAFD